MGVAGIVLAISALAFTIVPTIGWVISIFCIVTGSSLSSIGLIQNRMVGKWDKRDIAGIATNVAVIVVILVWYLLIASKGIEPE